jgi:hypothetical protein
MDIQVRDIWCLVVAATFIAPLAACQKPDSSAAAKESRRIELVPTPAESRADALEFFQTRFEMCEHFSGEVPYDAERRAFLERAVAEHCPGLDRELVELKKRFKDDAKTLEVLKNYEQ